MRVYEVFKHCKYAEFEIIKLKIKGADALDYNSKITRYDIEILIEKLKEQGMLDLSKKLRRVLEEEALSVVLPSDDKLSSFVMNTYSKLLAFLGGSNKGFEESSKAKDDGVVWEIKEEYGSKKEHNVDPEKGSESSYEGPRKRR